MKKTLKATYEIVNYLKEADPILANIIDENNLIERLITTDYYESLVSSIVSQQLSGRVAEVIWKRLLNLLDNKLDPKTIIDMDNQSLRNIGLSTRKIEYLKNLSDKVISGSINLDTIDTLDNQAIIDMLVTIKGIGPWTAEMFLIFSLGREDVFSTRDGGLQRAVQKLYQLDKIPSLEELTFISNKWSPYRTYASFYLWASLTK